MSYDLRRLRLRGLIERVEGTNAYRITPDGQRFAVFYTKLHTRLLRPLMAADRPPSPPGIRQALATLDRHITRTIDLARLAKAA
jgi:predicted MarR family transcription regulator